MSAVSPHIRVLRAEAKALVAEAETFDGCAEVRTAKLLLISMATAKVRASNELEAEERALVDLLKVKAG